MLKATINFKTMHANIKKMRRTLQPYVKICAVVKANAYSLGDITVSREIEASVDSFAVATIKEAVRLRTAEIKKPILMFGVCEDFKAALSNNITISINSVGEARNLIKYLAKTKSKQKCKIHIKVNTGMNRYGISNVWQLKKILAFAAAIPQIQVDGLYTQLTFTIDNTSSIGTVDQLKKFAPFRSIIRSHYPKAIIHAACSNNMHHIPAQFDMVRVGKALYGGLDGYRTAITVTSKIMAVQNVTKGTKIGYNGTESVTRPTICAVVPCGYADLAHYRFSNTHKVLIGSHICKVLGRVCMDTIIIDVTDVPKPLGKRVTIIGDKKGLSLMEIARSTKTIVCNLLCSFNFDRCKLVYKR